MLISLINVSNSVAYFYKIIFFSFLVGVIRKACKTISLKYSSRQITNGTLWTNRKKIIKSISRIKFIVISFDREVFKLIKLMDNLDSRFISWWWSHATSAVHLAHVTNIWKKRTNLNDQSIWNRFDKCKKNLL